MFAEINKRQISGVVIVQYSQLDCPLNIWIWDSSIVAITGTSSLIDRIESHEWLNSHLINLLK